LNGSWIKTVNEYKLEPNDIFRLGGIQKGEQFKVMTIE